MDVYDRITEAVINKKNSSAIQSKNIGKILKNQMHDFINDNIEEILNLIKTSSSPSILMPTDILYDAYDGVYQEDKRDLCMTYKDFDILLCASDQKIYLHIMMN